MIKTKKLETILTLKNIEIGCNNSCLYFRYLSFGSIPPGGKKNEKDSVCDLPKHGYRPINKKGYCKKWEYNEC